MLDDEFCGEVVQWHQVVFVQHSEDRREDDSVPDTAHVTAFHVWNRFWVHVTAAERIRFSYDKRTGNVRAQLLAT